MAEEDRWTRRGRRRWPFFRGWFSKDFDEIFREMEEMMHHLTKDIREEFESRMQEVFEEEEE